MSLLYTIETFPITIAMDIALKITQNCMTAHSHVFLHTVSVIYIYIYIYPVYIYIDGGILA